MGVYLSTPKTDKTSEDGENEKMRYGVSSMQGWRTSMEDAAYGHAALLDLDNSTSFFGVYDGHGGQAVSKFCAKFLHQQVIKHEAYSAGDIGTAAQKSFLRMDEMMCGQRGWRELAILGNKMDQFSGMIEGLIWSPRSGNLKALEDNWSPEEGPHSNYDGPTCGSTACVAIIHNNQLVVANAGDSRCVLSRKGEAYNLSKDHKPDLEVEKERIYKAGGYIQFGRVNGSLNLSRAIGILPIYFLVYHLLMHGSIRVELCEDDDFLVLACDGIWDCMSSQQLVDFVSEQLKTESKLSAVCEKVFDRCLAPVSGGEGCDNMTMILVQFKKPESGPSTSQPLDSSNDQEVPVQEVPESD
ncbi:probable protein phosphatase 2C 60 [Tanacetum coccineum]